jgi:hypothetical protein
LKAHRTTNIGSLALGIFGIQLKTRAIVIMVVGVLLLLAGITFALQGYGVLGPTSSFMYQSTTWIGTGAGFAIVGVIVVAVGLRLRS